MSEEPTQSASMNVVARNAVAAHSKNKAKEHGIWVVARWLEGKTCRTQAGLGHGCVWGCIKAMAVMSVIRRVDRCCECICQGVWEEGSVVCLKGGLIPLTRTSLQEDCPYICMLVCCFVL